jgi:CRISPR-associated protein (TIGR03986 family)
MTQKHISNVREERCAVAPYNFVELPDEVIPAQLPLPSHNVYDSQRYTGKIECTLTTSSPLYIRCGWTPSDFAKYEGKADEKLTKEEKKKWEEEKRKILASFYSHPDNYHPTIPGSSIRGMLHALVEIASHSKIDQVADRQLIYRAFADTTSLGKFYRDRLLQKVEPESDEDSQHRHIFLMRSGYLIQTQQGSGWAIQPAKDLVAGASFARIEINDISKLIKRPWHNIKHAHQVSVCIESLDWHPCREGYIELYYAKATPVSNKNKSAGVLVETGGMPGKKKLECVFGLPDEYAALIPIPDNSDYSMIQEYKEQITPEQKDKLESKDGVLKPMHPIFYLIEDGKLVFFGHTMMFRLPYQQSIKKFIPNNLYNSETQHIDIDIAEAIFGFIRHKKQGKEKAGRVFFSDAKCHKTADEDIWLSGNKTKSITPKILASPKPTTFQHYLVQDSENEGDLKHYASQSNETVIRGHKLYWHQGETTLSQIEKSDKTQDKSSLQYTDIKPIKPDISFDFTIRFENLSSIELGSLLWVLNIADDDNFRLSLGMGKPLGMGAVKISNQKLWLSDRQKRYQSLFSKNQWAEANRLDSEKEIREKCVQNFESYILEHINRNVKQLKDLPRIQSLLTILSWKGVSEDSGRYMEITRKQEPCIGELKRNGKGTNEYSKRPVLPIPLQVIKKILPSHEFKEGEIVEATVLEIDSKSVKKGNRTILRTTITYEVIGSDCHSTEEVNKKGIVLSIGEIVKVRIEKCQAASVRKVKRIDNN